MKYLEPIYIYGVAVLVIAVGAWRLFASIAP
jgi:hypothetical protein